MLTIAGNRFDLSLCGACLALLIADAAGVEHACDILILVPGHVP